MPKSFPEIGIQIPEVLLPIPQIDPSKWAIIACDQFTSQPEYWRNVEHLVGDSPSTLNMILPEVYLEKDNYQDRISRIHANMNAYLDEKLLQPYQGFVYVERTIANRVRKGLIAALDLEQYDYKLGSQRLIRATEGTIMERIPARIQVRQGAVLEIPHTLVLIDDPLKTVIDPLSQVKDRLKPLYDMELMMGSGHLSGWLVDQPDIQTRIIQALRDLAIPDYFSNRYDLGTDRGVMLFAVGDGNHACAAAKILWDELKIQIGNSMDHPARYAMVEIENLQDESLRFEPIHRVIFGIKTDIHTVLKEYFQGNLEIIRIDGHNALEVMKNRVDCNSENGQVFGMVSAAGAEIVVIKNAEANLAVGTLQAFLDYLCEENMAVRSDYVHGSEVVLELSSQPGNIGFYLPPIDKSDFFKTVILDGALPRKTFSMGAAREKRFYMESRRIIP